MEEYRFSKFFTFEELTNSKDHPELVANNRKDAMVFINAGKRLSKLLESVRHIWGDNRVNVTSGFRNHLLNAAVGSLAKSSAHLRFEAGDTIPSGMSINEAFTALLTAHRAGLLPDLRKAIREDHRGIIHIEVKMSASEPTAFYTTKDNKKFKAVK